MSTTRAAGVPVGQARQQPDQSRRDQAIDIALALLCIIPLLLTAHLPLTDLPNHLARQTILRDWASSPDLQAFYEIRWALVPNLALELFVMVARQIVSIDLAIRLFCVVTMLLLFCSTRLVNRTLGGAVARSYRAAPLLCYGGPFQYGFLSYCFGVGLALLLFGLYLRLRQGGWRPLVLLIPLSFVLLLCHLAAFGLCAIAVGACELTHGFIAARALSNHPRTRSWTLAGMGRMGGTLIRFQIRPLLLFVPAFLIFLWLSPTADHSATSAVTRFSNLHEKARGLAAITLFTQPALELALLGLAVAGVAIALLSRTLRLHPIGVTTISIMMLVWLALPLIALGGAYIDYRVPWAVAFFLMAALVPGARYANLVVPLGTYFGALAVARILLIAWLWLRWEPTLAAIDTALSGLPAGSRLMLVQGPSATVVRDPDLEHVAAYAVARRQAFEPGLFASLTGQILYFQPHYLMLSNEAALAVAIPSALQDLPPDYTYILALRPEGIRLGPRLPVACVASGPQFMLLKRLEAGEASMPCAVDPGAAGSRPQGR